MKNRHDRTIGAPIRENDDEGAILVLVALLSIGLLGLAGVVIDLGIVRRTQSEMQSATDQAALEGMRFRDVNGPISDRVRRGFATQAVRRAFGSDALRGGPSFGAGPDLARSDESGRFGGRLTVDADGDGDAALDLIPAPNEQNLRNGDLVAGQFDPSAPGIELSDYSRSDFRASPAAVAAEAPAFLARLRRTPTNGPRSNPLDRVPATSNAGPPVPLLFARGSLVQGPVIDDGMTVRATSIAATRPAVRVSSVFDGDSVLVMVPGSDTVTTLPVLPAFGLSALPTVLSFRLEFRGDGSILAPSIDSSILGSTLATPPRAIGQPVSRASVEIALPIGSWEGVLPILESLPTTNGQLTRVVGLIPVGFSSDGSSLQILISPTDRVLPVGATALDPDALAALHESPALRVRFESLPSRVLAAVLVR